MQCLTYADAEIALPEITVKSSSAITLPVKSAPVRFFADLNHGQEHHSAPLSVGQVSALAGLILNWLGDGENFLWMYGFDSDANSDVYAAFSAFRSTEQRNRPLLEAPVHRFSSTNVSDSARLLALLFLALHASDWDGFALNPHARLYLHFWDTELLFYSDDPAKQEEARGIAAKLGLKVREFPAS